MNDHYGTEDELEDRIWEFVKNYSKEECLKVILDHRDLKSLTVTVIREGFPECQTDEDMQKAELNEAYLKNPLKE
tara:strand:- start:5 stop:229 length:225 start_codon:yes stop_codon:yes gene_type:complete